MKINALQPKITLKEDKKVAVKFELFEKLIVELNKKEIPIAIANTVNATIEEINKFTGTGKETLALLRKKETAITKMIKKDLKLVTINHYKKLWMVTGMSAFGLPIGAALGISMGNIGLLGIGLPIGMGIGIAVGTALDKKAKQGGKQLEVELKY